MKAIDDPFAITVAELRNWLADKPANAKVICNPGDSAWAAIGEPFALIGWALDADGRAVILTG